MRLFVIIILWAALIGLLVYRHCRERRYLNRRLRDAIAPEFKQEIEYEDATLIREERRFKEALERARRRIDRS